MAEAGYSGTPLHKKLGLKDGQKAVFVDLPEALSDLSEAANFSHCENVAFEELARLEGPLDYLHLFCVSRAELADAAEPMRRLIAPDGMVWVSWPKKAAKMPTDMSEDVVREVLLPTGLVDVKVCAVDAVWSGLKLVIRKELR